MLTKHNGANNLNLRAFCIVTLSLLLTACAAGPERQSDQGRTATISTEQQVQPSSPDIRANQFILVEPLMPSPQRQLEIAQITQLLQEQDLNNEQRAVLLYRRGALYDALGMTTLARVDFNQLLEYRPGMADAYNYIGIHATQGGDYESAFEAFDSVIELDPDHPYVLLNRGIAAYYAGQYELAQVDFADHHYQGQGDAYRVLWLFFADRALNEEHAYQLLEQRKAKLDESWETNLVRLFTGEINAQQLMASTLHDVEDQIVLIERLTEAYFYLGKFEQLNNQNDDAANYFKLALATNLYEFVEHRYAHLELDKLRQQG
ncbi:lipoprotein NlpI [Aliidiomarina soli]|uniref:Lipoprotein NlpI n=1 Tax=Aliidiomarina soli TaxID=1928574 RepID=A0A432WL51_9GAMM|nr:lipoprotein NlpI [Aliidiomarina soli]